MTTTQASSAGTASPARTVALYRGRFDPPGLHHTDVLHALAAHFDVVAVVPWGPQPGRPINQHVGPAFRATMIEIAFRGLPRVEVDLADLEDATITEPLALEARYASRGDVWHVVELDALEGQLPTLPPGTRIVVVVPSDREIPATLPPSWKIVRTRPDVSGASMRHRLYRGELVDDAVAPRVLDYIERHGLYRGTESILATRRALPAHPRLLVLKDDRNDRAVAFARELEPFAVDAARAAEEHPDLVVVIGGDGSMLHAIQQHWRMRVPFLGLNAGHLGFLLNDPRAGLDALLAAAAPRPGQTTDLVLRHMPMLLVEWQGKDGVWKRGLTFNDAWCERATGQSAWLEVKVGGDVRLPRLVCDGVLVSTAAGSTAYARSMGAQPLLADTPAWLVVGSNVMEPMHWNSALLSVDVGVEIRSLHVEKRPLNGYLHGVPLGEVVAMRARISRAASVELAFLPQHDMAEKIARIQFPDRLQLTGLKGP